MTWQSFKESVKIKWNTLKENCKLSCQINSKDLNVYLKVIVYVLNLLNVALWHCDVALALYGPSQRGLYGFTSPTHVIILGGELVMILCLRRPSRLFEQVHLFPGTLLFGAVGALSLINWAQRPAMGWLPLLDAVLCVLISCVMMVDFILTELVAEIMAETPPAKSRR